ncbi:MAG: polysaccharide deacetylase family protein [Bacteroidota bacterium]
MTEILIVAPILLMLILAFLTIQFSLLIPSRRGLPVLMYHKISESGADGLTVTTRQFEQQLQYLKQQGYQSIGFKKLKSLVNDGMPLPRKSIILTFDDAYRNFLELALPLLKKYQFSATVFVPVAYIGKTNIWDNGGEAIMNDQELKRLALNDEIEVGLHSFLHRSFGDMTPAEIRDDLESCSKTLRFHGIPFVKTLAYPYGGYPKKDAVRKAEMISVFKNFKLDFALRIGNRINPWTIRQPFEIKRIDIKGTDSFFIFRTKVRKGRAKLFA